MIPALHGTLPEDGLHARFVAELTAAGFTGEISVSEADRTVFSTDNSVYQVPPRAVLFPRCVEDVTRVLQLLALERFQAVVLAPRGGGTGTNGQSLTSGLILDLSRHMNAILEINIEERWARVQAGVVKDQLNAALAAHGLFFTPELSTSNRATIGGMINTDASGQGSVIYGKTRNHVLELTSVLADGQVWRSQPMDAAQLEEIQRRPDLVGAIHRVVDRIDREHAPQIEARFPRLNRCLTGYDLAHIRNEQGRFNLNSILCGSEGTLAVIVEAKLNVMPIPRVSALINIRYDNFDSTLRDAQALMACRPASIEALDSRVLGLAKLDVVWESVQAFFPLTDPRPILGINIVEFVGEAQADVEAQLQKLVSTLESTQTSRGRLGYTVARGADVQTVWKMRKRAAGMLGNMPGEKRPITFVEDTAVPPENLADYIQEFRALLDSYGLQYGMFGHVDAGVLHVRPAIDMKDPEQAVLIRKITDEIARLTQKYGGVLWGEHGKGVRSEYAPAFFGSLYPQVQAVKAVFDLRNQLNPGKVATPGDQALIKLDEVPTRGESERTVPASVRGGYAEAVFCNGNGACYNFDPDDAMCPSWKGTRERRHSPKGRATLTREWLRRLTDAGVDPVAEARQLRARSGWHTFFKTLGRPRSEGDFSNLVKEAMDGCLACKSCVTGCPLKVDVPSFRAKFLELYHSRYPRPLKDYLVGSLEHMLPLAARVPALYNVLLSGKLGKAAVRWAGMVDIPTLSPIRLRQQLDKRGLQLATPEALRGLGAVDRKRAVIIVQDAFTSYYETRLVLDVLDLLVRLGYTPFLAPYQPNGKALHVHGFLGAFHRVALSNATKLRELASTGIPLVGIDPSVTLTFRAEYREALGKETVPEVLLLQEWLGGLDLRTAANQTARYRLLPHCTERALAANAVQQWQQIFQRLGLHLEVQAAGCCGMAGTYGHEVRNRTTSERIYDLSWRRHVDQDDGVVLLASGYSCRSQAKRLSQINLPHPAQALLAALRPVREAVSPDRARSPAEV
jgi:FAD/FMN-containing dehydrogenase/Fe-S oxidoreductase